MNQRKSNRAAGRVFDLRVLHTFRVVGESGTMTTAASKLGMTQPAVSQVIRQLETDLEVTLLDRDLRPLRLTPAGRLLLERAKLLLAESERVYREVKLAAGELVPVLKVGLVDSFAVTVGPPLVSALKAEVKHLIVWSGLASELRENLISRDLDLIVTPEPLDNFDQIRPERLFEEHFMLLMPASFRLKGQPVLGELVKNLPFIRYSRRSFMGSQIERHLRWLRLEAPNHMELDGTESVLAMVAEGIGWAISTPLSLLQSPAAAARIRMAPLPGPTLKRCLYLGYREEELLGLPTRVAQLSRTILRQQVLPGIKGIIPWLKEEAIVFDE